MRITCPRCGASPQVSDINMATDLALCRPCEEPFRLSEALPRVLPKAPLGAWYLEHSDGFEVGATTRSPLVFLFLPLTILFLALLSQFAFLPPPRHSPLLALLPISLFTFLIALCGSLAAMAAGGRCVVRVRGAEGEIFLGIRHLGWRRRFRWTAVSALSECATNWGTPWRFTHTQTTALRLQADRRIVFGTAFSDERREFVLEALKFRMAQRDRLPQDAPYRDAQS
jgi:hypothetical protein